MKYRTASELLAFVEALKVEGLDLDKIDCWGWDDGGIIFDIKGQPTRYLDPDADPID